MTLADERLKELDSLSLTIDERAAVRCRVAADLIQAGQYEAAREALGELWRGAGVRPNVEGLGEMEAAEVLLQAGALSGWLGKVKGAQESAKDLISESDSLFERLGEFDRAAAARSELALCYWREGAFDEARAILENASALIKEDATLKLKTVLRLAVVEFGAGRYSEELRLLTDAAPLLDGGASHYLRGSFHNELALVLRRLGAAEGRQDYLDRAIIEYTAAAYHFELAHHERYVAHIENNLAFLLYTLGRNAEAHEHLDRAQTIYTRLRDAAHLAHVDETRARVLVAEKRYREADHTLAGALKVLERGDESGLLADAFTIQGIVWARLAAYENSVNILRRAADVAESVGALTKAGHALLTLMEEHGASRRLTPSEVYDAYLRANGLLNDTQDAEALARLRACSLIVMRRLSDPVIHEKNFSLYGAVQDFEARLIGQALDEAGGSITNAARILGLPHQTLDTMLKTRHNALAGKRKPTQRRLKSIIKEPKR